MNDRTLYRDPRNGKLAGVCAGLAEFFGVETWLVRILVASAAILGGGFLVILAYLALALMLEKKPYTAGDGREFQPHAEMKIKSKPWQTGESPHQLLESLEKEFTGLERSVQAMEAHVTSDTFKTEREFSRL